MSNTEKGKDYATFWQHTRVMYCNTKTNNSTIKLNLVLQAPKTENTESILQTAFENLEKRVKTESDYILDSTISVVSNYIYVFDTSPTNKPSRSSS